MDIQNSQIGQAFASNAAVSSARPSNESLDAAEQRRERSENADKSDNSQGVNVVSNNDVITSENSVQASQNQVDNLDRERVKERLDSAVQEVESFLKGQNRNLTFSIDDETKRSIVTVKDSQSGDVIRQIPSEEVLKLAERIQELQQDVGSSVGVFINNEV